MKQKKIGVIGAGLGGLAISALMASRGHEVTVFEKNSVPGGKMNQLQIEGYRFDTGPSLLTMPFVLEELFRRCGADLNDYLTLQPLEPLCRYFYSDGTTFDSFPDVSSTEKEIHKLAPADAPSYRDFLNYASQLYDRTKEPFLFNPLYDLSDLGNLNLLDFFRIDAFSTVSDRVDDYFSSSYLQQFFKRFTTYNGSSPYQAPATLNVIPHVELSLGGYYVKGGIYQVVEALTLLAIEQGVSFEYDTEVKEIQTSNGEAAAIQTKDGRDIVLDLIISNSDATETYLNLLDDSLIPNRKQKSLKSLEPSCSGLVLLLGASKRFELLAHHNIYFSGDYRKEFHQIFREKVMPDDPTIYVANTSISDPDHAPEDSSNLFVLVNAPYLSEHWSWSEQQAGYTEFVIQELESRGLEGLSSSLEVKHTITPVDFYEQYRSNKGSIYGTSSNNRFSAFLRPANKSRHIDKLYLVGGSTHPGGGIPLVILSAFHALELIQRYENEI